MYPGGGAMSPSAVILDAEGTRLSAAEKALFRATDPFGFILFGRNLESADQIAALCGEMRESVGREALILIDQEGGRVQRLRPPLARDWPAPLDHIAAAGDGAVRALYLRYRLIAHELRMLGIDGNCAPVADLALDETHPFLRNRCYGDTPARVAELGRAVAQGLVDGGVLPVVKHIPGHGRARTDSHHELPRVGAPLDLLEAGDFAPFRALADLPLGMTAHVVYEALDPLPATVSPHVIALIRDSIGFDGLLMSDDISMKALTGTPQDNARACIAAGCDIALFCNGTLAERDRVAHAAGRMGADSLHRAETALSQRHAPLDFDIKAAWDELAALAPLPPGAGS
ncbi:beta-N-acetylhexosaminidase [Pontibaca methylaminivorans]|uniref:beta-N-acetylhexosaminidase n=1 Tax=Pontibaca methylaminivorans TaxID=515897 RepID=A0A1R3WHY2_9RHOB|nr:beta-N-acetylhexosaminidase [Pontibaca methylaminivorans]SIT76197.1 beta-N-acetylhexosaminidase [Pontibaca methylaminivorans]